MSGGIAGTEIDLSAVAGEQVDSGVEHGVALLAYVDAVMGADAGEIGDASLDVERALGKDGVSDAAAVIAMFNVVDRVADATGIPIDDGMTRDMRYAVGEELGMSHLTPEQRAAR